MRLIDLLRPHLDGVHTVVDATTGELDLEPYLHLPEDPEGIGYVRDAEPEEVGAGSLALVTLGPDELRHGDVSQCRDVIARIRAGGRALVLFGHPVDELPYHLVLDDLVAHSCQVLQAASLDYDYLTCGIAVGCVRELQPPRDYWGRPVVAEAAGAEPGGGNVGPAGLATQLRIAGEYVLTDFVTRRLRARLLDLEGAAPVPSTEEFAVRAEELERQRDQLQQELRTSEAQLHRAESRLAALESSTTMRVGEVVVGAARRRGRGAVRLPRELYRLWRGRGPGTGQQPARNGTETGTAANGQPHEQEHLLVSHSQARIEARTQLVVAGALTEQARAALAPHAAVTAMLPHDAALVVDRTSPDVVIVQAAACRPGGSWAYAGTAGAPDRDRRLVELAATARARGCPVVLWRDEPAHAAPLLNKIRWDAVVTGGLGVALDEFNPIDLDPQRPTRPVFVGPRDPREPLGSRRLLDEVLRGVDPRVVEPVTWRELPTLYRAHALFVTGGAGTTDRVLHQLACGARPVSPASDDPQRASGPAGPASTFVSFAAGAEEAAKQARTLAEEGPRDPGELRVVLREIFTRHAVPVRLAAMSRRLGLGTDPLASRRMSVLARLGDDSEAGRFADAVLSQRHRPAEVVVHGPRLGERVLDELTGSGIEVRRGDRADWAGLASVATSPWVCPWEPETASAHPGTYLLDLACAAECSRADAVGPARGGAEEGADYVFVPEVKPALVRRDLVAGSTGYEASDAGGLPVRAWVRRGARAFALAPLTPDDPR